MVTTTATIPASSSVPPQSAPSGPAVPGAPTSGEPGGSGSSNNSGLSLPPAATGWVGGLREITTTVIAAVVVIFALTLLYVVFESAKEYEEKKDVMLCMLPILGSVIGYYFGRVPAERRAEAAEQGQSKAQNVAVQATENAGNAQRQVEGANGKLAQAKVGVDKAKTLLQPVATAQRKTLSGGGQPQTSDESYDAWLELEALSRIL